MEQEIQGSIPALGKTFFLSLHMDNKEIEDMRNHRLISDGPFF